MRWILDGQMTNGCRICKCIIILDHFHGLISFFTKSKFYCYILYLYHYGCARDLASLELVFVCEMPLLFQWLFLHINVSPWFSTG